MTNKNNRKSSDKYHRILDAAVKVFAEQGFFQTTVSQIAGEAGVADGTIYLYFKNKDDLLLQFFNYKTNQVLDQFRQDVAKADNAEKKLRNLVHSHLTAFEKDYNMAVVYQTEARKGRHLEKSVENLTKMYLSIVGEIIEQGQTEGRFRKDLYFSLVKRFILGAVEEVIHTWVNAGGKYELTPMVDPLVDLILNGIKGKSAP